MPIGSIVITEDPVSSVVAFRDSLILGASTQWGTDSYEHEIRSMGGFWKCQFDLLPNKLGIGYLEEYLENGLGRNVESFTEDGAPAWQGKITAMRLELPGVDVSVSLRDMTNKTWVRYLTSEGGLIKRSTKQQDTDSQSKYGIKEVVLSGAIIKSSAIADQVAAAYLAEYADPTRTRATIKLGGMTEAAIKLKVFCEGYIKTLGWRTFNKVTAHTLQNLSVQIQDVIDDVGDFIASTDLVTNTTQVSQEYNRDELAENIIMDLARMADSSDNRYIIGMYEDRKLIYELAQSLSTEDDIRYALRVRDNRQAITDLKSGNPISPAKVRPNNWLRVLDLFPTKIAPSANIAKDPQVTFVESVIYREPIGITIPANRAVQIDNLMAKSGFGGVSQI